ncbi:SEC12 2 [Olea europaea subsp. europaea]|uniref:SEC12 2 n=2 Tax=Olea europaea subsp. europaea TaxID=158383 RepID=A0A8S0RU45_OLEEU|nr:SEC12 2 [Olea europaea subsp. europaea]
MGKSNQNNDASNCKKYGIPLYGAAWVPPAAASTIKSGSESTPEETEPAASSSSNYHIVLAGGGGEGRSGIPNALLVSTFDFSSNSLSDQPVGKLGTGSDLPYRIAVHPGGEGLICSLPKSCRWFDWDAITIKDELSLSLKSSEKVLEKLEDVGQQLALTFNNEGTLLAVGGEDGKLRVFKWPDMDITLDEANAHASVKDLDFSPDGNFLASVGSGPGRIWKVATATSIASLPKENDEIFGFCKFSRSGDSNLVLYVTAMRSKGGSIVKWNTTSWKRISSTHIVRDPISAFNVSSDGKLLVVGTIQGDIWIISSVSTRVQTVVRKVHLGLVTALGFSQDSRALLSASLDSSARVTLIKDKKKDGLNLWFILFIILVAVAVYYGIGRRDISREP